MTRELAKLRHGRSTRQHRERGAGPVCNAARGNCKLGHPGTAVPERPTLVKERNRRIREYNSTSGECGNSRLAGESVLRLSWVLGSGAGP